MLIGLYFWFLRLRLATGAQVEAAVCEGEPAGGHAGGPRRGLPPLGGALRRRLQL